MRKNFVLLGLALFSAAVSANSWAEQGRIHFAKGAISTEVPGKLRGLGQEVCYVAAARAGQHMKVEIVGDGPTRGTVKAPSGQGEGQPGGMIYDEDLTETGDYRICVEESQMANPWSGNFTLKLYIK